ncbi:MAG TPA: MBL fold metallo-hydrolase [archaeon]|nr:MBL fold metallo-hydrolase [archaeon]
MKVAEQEGEPTQFPERFEKFVDAVIVSHAHLDHSGNIPSKFAKSGKTLAYSTPPTLDIAHLLWLDSLKISRADQVYLPFDELEITAANQNAFTLGYKKELPITDNTVLKFHDAGHIPGSALTALHSNVNGRDVSVMYTGDFHLQDTRLVKGAKLPSEEFDVLITESTYADKDHPPRNETEKAFLEDVEAVIENDGTALVASFAVGRCQELIHLLASERFGVPIYLDGMGQKACQIVLRYPEFVRDYRELKKAIDKTIWVKHMRMRQKLAKDNEPKIIITSAGMLNGGPVVFYLKHHAKDPNSKVFLTGYQVAGTNGRRLLDTGSVVIDGEEVSVKMKAQKYDFSAHAGKKELQALVKKVNPEKLICVHGDPKNTKALKEWAESETGIESFAPAVGDSVKW